MCAWSRLDQVGGGLRLRVGGLVRHQCLLPSAQDLFFYCLLGGRYVCTAVIHE
jgi:hypothetical protein